MYTQDLTPVAGSLLWSALVALIPLLTVCLTLAVLRWKAHWAGLSALGAAVLVAVLVYRMPPGLAALSAVQGFAFGKFPILWIVVSAIALYELTVRSGRFEDLRLVIDSISTDRRIQAILIAFCFGGLLEALAGFGAPVAITGVMLVAIGLSPLRAATVALLANTAPVAFGAIATPIITAGTLTGIDYREIGAIVGHQTPPVAMFVPLFLVLLVDGARGVREVWPIALVTGTVFALAQWVSATWISVELTDIASSLAGLAAVTLMLRFWQPGRAPATVGGPPPAGAPSAAGPPHRPTSSVPGLGRGRTVMALFPYLLVVAVFSVAKLWGALREALEAVTLRIPWPGLDGRILTAGGERTPATVYSLPWLSSPGTLLLICGVVVAMVYRMPVRSVADVYLKTLARMRAPAATVTAVLALAYVMNLSGQTLTIGAWIAGAGAAFAFLAPVLGWLGTAVTGSDTSANALFATLQQAAAERAGLDPAVMVAANTSGGVVGKMLSPQNLAIAASAVGIAGQEADLFRRIVWWSLGMLLALCLLVGLQSSVLAWMLPT